MCGRYILSQTEDMDEIKSILEKINQKFKEDKILNKLKVGEIYPTDFAPIIVAKNLSYEPTISRWGLPMKDKKQVIINARAETILEKYPFNKILQNRCLIPASGYFEWQKTQDGKKKLIIRPKSSEFFYMAGLYQNICLDDGRVIPAYVIITTEPSPMIKDIHDRMPVILKKEHQDIWLFEKVDEKENKIFFDSILTSFKDELIVEAA